MKRWLEDPLATEKSANGNSFPSEKQASTGSPLARYDTAIPMGDPRTAAVLKQIQAKMAEMERIVGEVGGLETQLAGEEDAATVRAVERTKQAFQSQRRRHQLPPRSQRKAM